MFSCLSQEAVHETLQNCKNYHQERSNPWVRAGICRSPGRSQSSTRKIKRSLKALLLLSLFCSSFKSLTAHKLWDIIVIFLCSSCITRWHLLLKLLRQLPKVVQVIWPWKLQSQNINDTTHKLEKLAISFNFVDNEA